MIIKYILFFWASHSINMSIFSFSTYHKYFIHSVPFIVVSAIAQAYFLCFFQLEKFFIWHLSLMTVIFLWLIIKNRLKSGIMQFSAANNVATRQNFANSFSNTLHFLTLSSAIYIGCFITGFAWIFNKYFV